MRTGHVDVTHSERAALGAAALRSRGDAPALIVDGHSVSYAELADRVERRSAELGVAGRLVAMRGENDVEFVVTWLAALEGATPIVLLDGERSIDAVRAAFDPDVVVTTNRRGVDIEHVRSERDATHDIHPDLAMMMATSGSTGRPKLVRLSLAAVTSNARSIATYLGLTADDRGITSLPLHYCYGLSVVSSHLAVGASIVLTDTSVVDPCFRDLLHRHEVTGLAGVPYTFEMIDRIGLDMLRVPSLRYVTQAGGRMRPDDVARYAEFGREVGWDLFVMYGQTEATARMAYLPPDQVHAHPAAIGRAVPGGSITLWPIAEPPPGLPDDVGEIVYRGPNVMMGYATCIDDLARGSETTDLRTGDIGRVNEAGLIEIVGRSSRFLKIHGKRVELDHVEAELAVRGWRAWCAGDDDGLVVVTEDAACPSGRSDDRLLDDVLAVASLPAGRVTAVRLPAIPRTPSGKVDSNALVTGARAVVAEATPHAVPFRGTPVASTFAEVLRVDRVDPDATFATLGGDSLSYVEMSIRLETLLGDLPADWHLVTVGELETSARTPRSRRFTTHVETSVVLRAIGIVLIVCTHMKLYRLPGGAHGLLAVVGYNVARFQLGADDVAGRVRRSMATIARVAVPTSLWIGVQMLLVGGYSTGALFLVNNYFGSPWRRDGRWEYWYFEAFVQVMLALTALFSIGAVRRAERRAPYAFALGVLAVTALFRFRLIEFGDGYNDMFRPHTVAVFVALGWCAQRSRTTVQRLATTALAVATTIGYFDQPDREMRIVIFVAALVWIPRITVPRPAALVIGAVASASMYTFLVHWQVWPLFTPWLDDHVALVATIAAGVGIWWTAERLTAAASQKVRSFALSGRGRRTGTRASAHPVGV